MSQPRAPLDVDDAINFILLFLSDPSVRAHAATYGDTGYDVFLNHLMRAFVVSETGNDAGLEATLHRRRDEFSVFFDAAWKLCRRGILRPGVRHHQYQGQGHGHAGQGFSLTSYGRAYIAATRDLIPTQPGRFAELLAKSSARLGPGFLERSQEAITAYNARAYLACCAMCGAAAESVTLALAIGRTDEGKVLALYLGRDGRREVENLLVAGRSAAIREEFRRYTDLLKYWRDSAAHGRAINIDEPEAYSSLALLLRFARWADDRWSDLTAT